MADRQDFGIIGLGRIGGGLAQLALERGFRVAGFRRSGVPRELLEAGLVESRSAAAMLEHLEPPRRVMLYVPAGVAVDALLDELEAALEPGDVVVDGGNSYWGDSIRRSERLRRKELHFVDAGTSGGMLGARHGACFMVGGTRDAVAQVEPILTRLAVAGGYVHAGPPGAGHFVKLVHNGIEFGMMQAIGEGVDLLASYHEPLDVRAVLECWRHGSVIRSWLIDLLAEACARQPDPRAVSPHVEDTGEVNWLVADALRMEVPVPVIAQAVMQLFSARDEGREWARAIALMRHGFGGHPFGPDEGIARERRDGRVGPIVRLGAREQG